MTSDKGGVGWGGGVRPGQRWLVPERVGRSGIGPEGQPGGREGQAGALTLVLMFLARLA